MMDGWTKGQRGTFLDEYSDDRSHRRDTVEYHTRVIGLTSPRSNTIEISVAY
jgi:hypothetical protein